MVHIPGSSLFPRPRFAAQTNAVYSGTPWRCTATGRRCVVLSHCCQFGVFLKANVNSYKLFSGKTPAANLYGLTFPDVVCFHTSIPCLHQVQAVCLQTEPFDIVSPKQTNNAQLNLDSLTIVIFIKKIRVDFGFRCRGLELSACRVTVRRDRSLLRKTFREKKIVNSNSAASNVH